MWLPLLTACVVASGYTGDYNTKLPVSIAFTFEQEAAFTEYVRNNCSNADFECEATFLLREEAPWDPSRGLWLWMRGIEYYRGAYTQLCSSKALYSLFWKSVKHNDLSILKHLIDYDSEDPNLRLPIMGLLEGYFTKWPQPSLKLE